MDSLLVLQTCGVHLARCVMLTDIFPPFVVTVRANPSLGPRNGEILWGIPILKRKHFVWLNSLHSPGHFPSTSSPNPGRILTFLPFLLSLPALCSGLLS